MNISKIIESNNLLPAQKITKANPPLPPQKTDEFIIINEAGISDKEAMELIKKFIPDIFERLKK